MSAKIPSPGAGCVWRASIAPGTGDTNPTRVTVERSGPGITEQESRFVPDFADVDAALIADIAQEILDRSMEAKRLSAECGIPVQVESMATAV